MNAPEISYEPTDTGFHAYFRKPSKADRIYVCDDHGDRILFSTALDALKAAGEAFIQDRYGTIRGERCASTGARAKAEALFDPEKLRVVKQRGKSKPIEVVR